MLRISKLTDYATVIMTHIAHNPAALHAATDIAKETGFTLPTVSKILKLLVKANLLESKRGTKGGYVLQGGIADINIAQIITAIEGPISMTECATDIGSCDQEASCEIKGNWSLINRKIYSALEDVKLVDLLESPNEQKVNVMVPKKAAIKPAEPIKVES